MKTVNLQVEMVNICHYGKETSFLGWLHSHNTFADLNLQISSDYVLGPNIEEAVK